MSDIKYTYPLILNKVASPRYATPVLRRARLVDWLNEAANCRAVVVAADAGYGKTTLLWQWEREVSFRCYWYKLDRTDRDWTFHISYLIEAISKEHRGFGRRAHSVLQQMGGPSSSRPGVAAYLVAEMHQRLVEPCTFIVDDWQYVNAVTEVRGLWNQILRDAPPTCRFVFLSRVKPKLQFARFKTHGGYAELRTDALRFTEDEIDELFRDIYNDPLEATELVELERRTEGWAASLQLVEVSLRDRTTADERGRFIRSITATRDSDLFEFLAEEVLDQQPAETKNFLLSTSILHQITPEIAERLTGAHDGRRELVDLEHRGLFTNRLDELRFRYHNLFREFLERRLAMERSEAEVVGLHIHAASYFETSQEWPHAIHHYLRAGLQRQAARLIAKYGEEVVAEGRLGLVDEWLRQLPIEAVRGNARLSLLHGEACGMRGDWEEALSALQRARSYFARKGDRRLEALACLKLSSVYSNYGDPESAADVAASGVELAPPDAVATKLRLEGNLAITRTRLSQPLDAVLAECRRIATESASRGMEHYAAIAHHNAGEVLQRMGRYQEAAQSLEAAAAFWEDPPTSPFADNYELVNALLSIGDSQRARKVANEALLRTRPWRRPYALALFAMATVHTADGRHSDAIEALQEAVQEPNVLGPGLFGMLAASLVEALYLDNATAQVIAEAYKRFARYPSDPRHEAELTPARAIATHSIVGCRGACCEETGDLLAARANGAIDTALVGEVKIGALRLAHGRRSQSRRAWIAASQAVASGLAIRIRPWLRLYAGSAAGALELPEGAVLLARLAAADPEAWRIALVDALRKAMVNDRQVLLDAISKHANRDTVAALQDLAGRDIAETRRQLQHARADRLYLRTFGGLSLHRGDWSGPALPIEKRRVRMLLAVLAARARSSLNRDVAIDILWPSSDADAAINSLNQTVFQLRRTIDTAYRGGDSPEYVISTADQIALNPDLVHTDLDEVMRLPHRLTGGDWVQRQAAARRTISLIRGEFLADLRYEEWTAVHQVTVHNDVRNALLPIAQKAIEEFDIDVSIQAASALVTLDPYDEAAVLALADCLTRTGRRVAAKNLVVDYIRRLEVEQDGAPSPALIEAAAILGSRLN